MHHHHCNNNICDQTLEGVEEIVEHNVFQMINMYNCHGKNDRHSIIQHINHEQPKLITIIPFKKDIQSQNQYLLFFSKPEQI
jgi:hypothetical protein